MTPDIIRRRLTKGDDFGDGRDLAEIVVERTDDFRTLIIRHNGIDKFAFTVDADDNIHMEVLNNE